MNGIRFFDRPFSFLLVLLCLPLLFLPKINLISLGAKETAGIRIDDILLLFFGVLIGWAHFVLNKRSIGIERRLLVLVAFSLFSFLCNRVLVAEGILNVDASLFYCFRIAEYFLFFYIGVLSTLFFNLSSIVGAFFLWNLVLMLLQKMGLIGTFSNIGYIPLDRDRVAGISSFPSEAGMLINMAFCYLAFDEEKSRRLTALLPPNTRAFFSATYIYWLFLVCSVLVILTGSRIAILAMLIPFFFRIKDTLHRGRITGWVLAIIFLCLGIIVGITAISNISNIYKRSEGLLSFENIELFERVWDRIDLAYDPLLKEAVSYGNYDMSWWMRIHKWCYALKMYYTHPECYLQGIGPGFAKAAMDGGFVRILTEYGLIGCILFWRLFSWIWRQSRQLKWMMIAFLINMIFFDVFMAYKPMSLLFFVSGATYALMDKRTVGTLGTLRTPGTV